MSVERQTKYCVRCLERKATLWTGHVVKKGKLICAGWCAQCQDVRGFVGHYKKKMKNVKDKTL